MDVARGFPKENLKLKQEFVMGSLWIWEFFVKALAYFFIVNYVKKVKELLKAQQANIEQQKELQAKELEEERARQIEVSYTRLETVFTNLIHETKTPLTLLTNCFTNLEKKIGSMEELKLIKSCLGKLSKDISNIFDIERVKKGKEFFDHNQECNFSELLTDNISIFEFYSAEGKTKVVKDIGSDLIVKADPAAINRIVNNLIENAIKFSGPSSTISIFLLKNDESIILSIEDEGSGIPDEELQHIFTPYYQLNKSKRNLQGMGLGLPMVKSILDSIGGKIAIRNKNNGLPGIIVTVNLPASASLWNEKRFDVEKSTDYNFTEFALRDIEINDSLPNILVVEDHIGLNHHISQALGEKFNVSYALNGQQALQKITIKIPDLIISDVMMDVMDGFEMAHAISENSELSHIPIIFLSARSTLADKIHGLNLGAVDYIEKPFATDELRAKVESFLLNKEKGHQVLYNFTYERMKREEQHKKLSSRIEEITVKAFDRNCENFLLTAREKEVANLVVEGLSAKAIAEKISRSENTVKNHVSNIYEKVGVNKKIDLIKMLNS